MSQATQTNPRRWENILFGTTTDQVPNLIPGVVLASVVVVAAAVATEFINSALGFDGLVSFILVAIVFGMIIRNTVGLDDRFAPGIAFSLKKLLRLGIILLGIRLSILNVLEVGIYGVPIVAGAVLTGLGAARIASRRLELSDRLGTLIAIGTGICGATAIVAIAPGINAKEEEVAYAVANITIFGIFAMLVYPFVGNLIFGGDIVKTGLFLGTSIHETAQVAGAGLIYDQLFNVTAVPSVADIAVVAKLVRNVLMVAVIPVLTYLHVRQARLKGETAGEQTKILDMLPVFILGFVAMAALRSIGDAGLDSSGQAFGLFSEAAWNNVTHGIRTWAEYTLATAMAAVGLGTSIAQLKGLGTRPFIVGMTAAVAVGVASVGLVSVFGLLITI